VRRFVVDSDVRVVGHLEEQERKTSGKNEAMASGPRVVGAPWLLLAFFACVGGGGKEEADLEARRYPASRVSGPAFSNKNRNGGGGKGERRIEKTCRPFVVAVGGLLFRRRERGEGEEAGKSHHCALAGPTRLRHREGKGNQKRDMIGSAVQRVFVYT